MIFSVLSSEGGGTAREEEWDAVAGVLPDWDPVVPWTPLTRVPLALFPPSPTWAPGHAPLRPGTTFVSWAILLITKC